MRFSKNKEFAVLLFSAVMSVLHVPPGLERGSFESVCFVRT